MTQISALKNNDVPLKVFTAQDMKQQVWGDLTNVQKQQEVELKSLPVTEHRPPDR